VVRAYGAAGCSTHGRWEDVEEKKGLAPGITLKGTPPGIFL
jgi:hypothetical protein